jgi:hypothetical protein
MRIALVTAIGCLLAAALIALLGTRYRSPPGATGPVLAHPKARLLRWWVLCCVLGWLGLIAVVICTFLLWVGEGAKVALLWCLGFALLFGLVGQVIGLRIRCVNYGRLLAASFGRPKYSEPRLGLEGGSAIVIRVLKRETYRCVHCGQRYSP